MHQFFRFGEVSHYILNEQIAEYGKTFTVPKTSIYKPKMDQALLRVVQAGLGKLVMVNKIHLNQICSGF